MLLHCMPYMDAKLQLEKLGDWRAYKRRNMFNLFGGHTNVAACSTYIPCLKVRHLQLFGLSRVVSNMNLNRLMNSG